MRWHDSLLLTAKAALYFTPPGYFRPSQSNPIHPLIAYAATSVSDGVIPPLNSHHLPKQAKYLDNKLSIYKFENANMQQVKWLQCSKEVTFISKEKSVCNLFSVSVGWGTADVVAMLKGIFGSLCCSQTSWWVEVEKAGMGGRRKSCSDSQVE